MTDTAKAQVPTSPWRDRESRAFLIRKLFSLTGVVPVAGYTVFHLWKNATALHGRDAYTQMVEEIAAIPYVFAIEVVFIIVPIFIHAILGVLIVLDARYNVGAYRYSRNWMFTLQRASGVAALGFILYHLYELRFQKLMGSMAPAGFYDELCANLSSTAWGIPVVALLYVFGIAAIAFHLANGLWGFLCSWGITVTRRSQRISASIMGIVGLAVFVLGANTAVYFATGSKLYAPSSMDEAAPGLEHCPGSANESPAKPAIQQPPAPAATGAASAEP